MKVLGAIGFGLAIIFVKFLVPVIFTGIESTIIMSLDTVQIALQKAQAGLNAVPF